MFTLNTADANTTLSGLILAGEDGDTIISQSAGNLTLTGGVELIGTETAVDVTGGNLTVGLAELHAARYSISMGTNSGTLTLSPESGTVLTGSIYLGSGKQIDVTKTLTPLENGLTVVCEAPAGDAVIAAGSGDYALTAEDAAKVSYINEDYRVLLNSSNQLVLGRNIILDGTSPSGGSGTMGSPYNTLALALNALSTAGSNAEILVIGTTTLSPQTYSTAATIRRSNELTGVMFQVAGEVTLSGQTIDGGGIGTIVNVASGSLTLNGGVTLTNCETAVNLAGGTLTLNQAVLNATQYSVNMTSTAGDFTLMPQSGTEIEGAIYLATGKAITVRANLTAVTGDIQVTSQSTTRGTMIAYCTTTEMASASAPKLIVNGKTGRAVSNTVVI
jgi:hypothetical protein